MSILPDVWFVNGCSLPSRLNLARAVDASYCYRNSVRPSVCMSVCLSHL